MGCHNNYNPTTFAITYISSSKDTKQNISVLGETTDLISGLKPYSYNYRENVESNKNYQKIKSYGLMVEESPREIINYSDYDENGIGIGNGISINYNHLTVMLLKEVQSLRKESNSLRKELNEIKKKF